MIRFRSRGGISPRESLPQTANRHESSFVFVNENHGQVAGLGQWPLCFIPTGDQASIIDGDHRVSLNFVGFVFFKKKGCNFAEWWLKNYLRCCGSLKQSLSTGTKNQCHICLIHTKVWALDRQITRCNQIINRSNHDMWLFDLQFLSQHNPNLFFRMTRFDEQRDLAPD